MTEKRYYIGSGVTICDSSKGGSDGFNLITQYQAVDLLNQLSEENEQLKQEKEKWKSSACSNASFNSIVLNELSIAQEQGYEVSDPFKKLMEGKGDVE